ncbi:unnamed protein product [Brachionus calyciflorus]|uniref:Uncharacterized protein n=1 Tax=Brachionus calyciflorus TaxID=104777 RepID=A0A814QZK1_9BILA|nr:unnamed protein product [Brachionus calyciflorus]
MKIKKQIFFVIFAFLTILNFISLSHAQEMQIDSDLELPNSVGESQNEPNIKLKLTVDQRSLLNDIISALSLLSRRKKSTEVLNF